MYVNAFQKQSLPGVMNVYMLFPVNNKTIYSGE